MIASLVALAVAVALGASAQRATGIGFNLVVGPACAALLGPAAAVGTLVRLAVVADLIVLSGERSHIDWPWVRRLVVPALAAAPPAVLVARLVPASALVCVASLGSLLVVGVLLRRGRDGRSATVGAASDPSVASPASGGRWVGFGAGFLGLTTGMCSPPLALHSARSERPVVSERASMAVFFLVVDLVAVAAHPVGLGPSHLVLLVPAAVVGAAGGAKIGRHVDGRRLRTAVLLLVACGACVALLDVLC